jgi:hypothetical protein
MASSRKRGMENRINPHLLKGRGEEGGSGMSKLSNRHKNFKELRAQYSERFRANGHYEGFKDVPTLFASLKEQYKLGWARIKELEDKPNKTDEERREMENHIRICGDWAQALRKCGQMLYENAFIVIAQARLPKEHFLVIADEARELWRDAGFADGLPIPQQKIKKVYRRGFRP